MNVIRRWSFAALFILAAAASTAHSAPVSAGQNQGGFQPDGPYVVATKEGWEALSVVVTEDRKLGPRTVPVKVGDVLTIPGVGDLPAFKVQIRKPATVAPDDVQTKPDIPIFVVADSHGQFQILVQLLRANRVLDEQLRWSFKKGHLVILGDTVDRGPNQTEILWLLYGLEAQARKAGGGVHLLLGNHETMMLRGDVRYLNPKYDQSSMALQARNYPSLWSNETLLGQWLRTKPAVLRLNRALYLHGGISEQVVERNLTLEMMNAAVRNWLIHDTGDSTTEFVTGREGPLWYRGYFPNIVGMTAATQAEVEAACAHFDVDRISVGHTIVDAVTPLYKSRAIAVNVNYEYLSDGKPVAQGMLIDKGTWYRANIDGKRDVLF